MFTTPKILFTKTDEDAYLPSRSSASDPGYHLKSIGTVIIPNGGYAVVDTGLSIADIVKGVWIMVLPLESLLENHGVEPVTRVINNSYRGDLKIKLYNHSEEGHLINRGDAFAQFMYFPLLTIEPEFNPNEPLQ